MNHETEIDATSAVGPDNEYYFDEFLLFLLMMLCVEDGQWDVPLTRSADRLIV
jgi:hypothetical protein